MKKLSLICMAALAFASCNNSTTDKKMADAAMDSAANRIDKAVEEPWVAVDSATEMKAWTDYSTPGESHKGMAKADGEWTGENTMWMKMGADPMKSTSTMTNKMILGGRYQMSTMKGNFMGMPFEGMAVTAYDNYKKKYVSTWIDNMGTGIMQMEGTWDPATNSFNYVGKMVNPANGRECTMREVFKIVDDNTHTMEMYGPDSQTGKEYKTMEIKLTRKK